MKLDWNTIVLALIAVVPTTVAALAAWRSSRRNAEAIQRVHIDINSRMTELLKASKAESKAEGREQGREEGKA